MSSLDTPITLPLGALCCWAVPSARCRYHVKHGLENSEKAAADYREIFMRHQVNPFMTFGMIFVQFPVFMAFFFALQKAPDFFPAMATGGIGWFPDLTQSDPSACVLRSPPADGRTDPPISRETGPRGVQMPSVGFVWQGPARFARRWM